MLILLVAAVPANAYRLAGFVAALSAAVWFDFFLTCPYAEFSISRRADIETTVLLAILYRFKVDAQQQTGYDIRPTRSKATTARPASCSCRPVPAPA